ncbi:MAG: hypothetical protein LBU82_08600 [Treponema sp.]|nr:hypothetical protein [Treponema sp.]
MILITVLVIAVSCGSRPKIEETSPPEVVVGTDSSPTDEDVHNNNEEIIKKEEINAEETLQKRYIATRAEVQHFIEDLNKIIYNGNYDMWKTLLSKNYLAKISSPDFLKQISELPAMKSQKIVLKSTRDYFNYVVKPSRADSRIDYSSIDIEYISENKVKAFTITITKSGETRQNLLYDLEHFGNSWKIVN